MAQGARPVWEPYGKGELMSEKDWWNKWYFNSTAPMRESYATVYNARSKEPLGGKLTKLTQTKSDTTLLRETDDTTKLKSQLKNQITALDTLLHSPLVHENVVHKYHKGSKYMFYGGGCASDTFKRNSKEDPWPYAQL